MGYTGGITIIKDYVKPFRPARNTPAVRRYETLPGKQAQMDWGITHYIDERGNMHKTPAFIMILGVQDANMLSLPNVVTFTVS
jgi:transposase